MRHFTLSDHTNDQASAAEQQRQTEFNEARTRYDTLINRWYLRQAELDRATQNIWAERRYFAWFASFFPRISHALSAKPTVPLMVGAQRDEIVFKAGAEGERKVVHALAAQLSDDWVAISGYKNPAGEVDVVVVGPPGVMAIEVKFLNGKVFCDGDRWWRDKYDRYGNLVERAISIVDRGGRGPSAQVNASADRLQRLLTEKTPVNRVIRVVVLAHESSTIGELSSITVDAITLVNELNVAAIFANRLAGHDQYLVDDLVRLIGQDHQFHEKRRPSASHRSGPNAPQAISRR
jgi:Nuclease-related domain